MDLDLKLIISILALILAIVRYLFPRSPKKQRLAFIEKANIQIQVDSQPFFKNLDLKYYDTSLNSEVRIFNFEIRNTGNIDISSEMLRENLQVGLPSYYKIIEAKPLDIDNPSKPIIEYNDEKFFLTWDLLKPNESIAIACLLNKIPKLVGKEDLTNENLVSDIKINPRITGLKNITKYYKEKEVKVFKTKGKLMEEELFNLFIALCLLSLTNFIFSIFYPSNSNKELSFWENFWDIFLWIFSIINILVAIDKFSQAGKLKK